MFEFRVRPDRLAEYGRRHGEVWPDMLRALAETGWRNYSIFTAPDGRVVGYFESTDPDAARAAMGLRDVDARWQAEMAEFFDGAGPAESMTELTEVFHLETQLAAADAAGTTTDPKGDAARTRQD
nr:L-rhamnose mutarotase [Isoptericola jiangsuensis]